MSILSGSVGSSKEPKMGVVISLSLYRRIETYIVSARQQFPNRSVNDYIESTIRHELDKAIK